MVHLLSVHVPKTAGTSFYRLLKANYPDSISESLRREHVFDMQQQQLTLPEYLPEHVEVVHGHVTLQEAMPLIARDNPRLVAFLRDPVDRVISNYCYFIDLLRHPEQQQQNPEVYELNKHRINESIFEYAAMEENRNVMSDFLVGVPLQEFFFIGLQSTYATDVKWLAQSLNWRHQTVEQHNVKRHLQEKYVKVDQGLRFYLRKLNAEDEALYQEAMALRQARGWGQR